MVLPLSAQRLCAQHSHGSRLAARGSGASPARESECVVTLTLVHPHPGAVCVSETRSKNAVTSISLPLDANPCSQTAQPQGTDSAPQPLLRGTTGEAERWSGPEAQARVPREAARPEQPVCRGTAWKGHPPDAEPYEK